MDVNSEGFIICPKCGKRTKTKINPDTVLKRFPLFCPWCKAQSIVTTKGREED